MDLGSGVLFLDPGLSRPFPLAVLRGGSWAEAKCRIDLYNSGHTFVASQDLDGGKCIP